MEKFKVDAIPELEMKDKDKLHRALEVLPKVRANYVLVICRPENLATIIEKVGQFFGFRSHLIGNLKNNNKNIKQGHHNVVNRNRNSVWEMVSKFYYSPIF